MTERKNRIDDVQEVNLPGFRGPEAMTHRQIPPFRFIADGGPFGKVEFTRNSLEKTRPWAGTGAPSCGTFFISKILGSA